MRKARAATTAAASKPKPKPKPRSRAAPKAKPSPASLLSGDSSPPSASGTSSPAAADLSFLSPSRSPAKPRTRSSPLASPAASSLSTIGDLRSLAASHLDSLKRRLDALHGDSVKDLEASHSRLSKRVKMQTHGCLQLAEEADKEHKRVSDKIAERTEVVKNSYKKFVAEVQASTSRVCKVTVPEMARSVERAIDGLRSRYNISATLA
ncbi:unnamed protein product [Urochloa humidicola]